MNGSQQKCRECIRVPSNRNRTIGCHDRWRITSSRTTGLTPRPTRVFSDLNVTKTRFLRMGGKVNAVTFKVSGGGRSRILSQNLEIQNRGSNMTISHTVFQWILDSVAAINLKTLTREFLRLVMMVLRSDFKIKNGGSNMACTYSKFNEYSIFLLDWFENY